ncbi:hypothetical protein KGO5_03090 [Sinorhizobium sp. KGO-5]|uniref:hypothetical protein n=1 Tax=Sinorhizobium sp. KGO-5 TaxID=1470810 RepID=UPI00294A870B|nr:hypothetical protein KGO5_03090 [Sinorhizobium sp. KGO-5]
MKIGFGIGFGKRPTFNRGGGAPVDAIVKRLAHRLYGPGHNSGSAPSTGDGTAKTYAATFVNESGAAITELSLVFQGWTLRTTGTTDASASYTVTGTIEYPVGTVVADIGSVVVTAGGNVEGDTLIPLAEIPVGGSFRVNFSSTVASGQTYIANLGFAGLRTHKLSSLLKKEALYAVGDSIMTNNNGAVYNAVNGKCPAYQASITGTTAATYGGSSAANFVKQVDLAKKLGITRFVSNFGTNDFGASTSKDTLLGYLTAMRSRANAENIKFTQATMLPRTSDAAAVAVTATSSGNTITATVPDASKYVVGMAYRLTGATQTEYNGSFVCTAVDTGANTVQLLFAGSATPTATGSPVLDAWKATNTIQWQAPWSSHYDPGPDSQRGQFNAAVRSGAYFDDYVEWADPFEPSRDAGRWVIGGENPLIPAPQEITISSVITTSRFNSNYNRGSSTIPNGFVQFRTGANVGVSRTGNGNTNGDITMSSAAPNTMVVGDTLIAIPGTSYCSDDGTHPRVAGGSFGGQAVLNKAMGDKITEWLS